MEPAFVPWELCVEVALHRLARRSWERALRGGWTDGQLVALFLVSFGEREASVWEVSSSDAGSSQEVWKKKALLSRGKGGTGPHLGVRLAALPQVG